MNKEPQFETSRLYYQNLNEENISSKKLNQIMKEEDKNDIFEHMILGYRGPSSVKILFETENIRREQKTGKSYIIRKKDNDKFVGITTYNKQNENLVALGAWLRKRYWGEGYCRETCNKIIELLLEDFNKIEIAMKKDNDRAFKSFGSIVSENGGEYIGIDEEYTVGGQQLEAHVFRI